MTTYSELNTNLARITGQPLWDFNNPAHRDAMARLLGRLADRSHGECLAAGREPVVISALCKFLNKNDAGDGFYRKAREFGLISDGMYKDRVSRHEWWAVHVGKVQDWLRDRRATGR